MTDQLVAPRQVYQRIEKHNLPNGMKLVQQGKNVYGWAPVKKINKGGGEKNARVLVLEDMFLVTTPTKAGDNMNRALKLGDINKMCLTESKKGYQVAIIPYNQCPDPGIMLGLLSGPRGDPTEILRILNFCREQFYGVPIPTERVAPSYLKRLLKSDVFDGSNRAPRRENYKQWSHRREVLPFKPRPPTPDLSSLRTYNIQLHDHNEPIGITMESRNSIVKARDLVPGSAAARAQIPPGVTIYSVQGKKVGRVDEVKDEIIAAKQAQFSIAKPEIQIQCYGNGTQGAGETNTFSVGPTLAAAPPVSAIPIPTNSPSQISQKSSTKSNRIETPIIPPPPAAGAQVFPSMPVVEKKTSHYSSGSSYDSDDESSSSFGDDKDYLPPTISFQDKTNNRIEFRREAGGLGEFVNGYRVGRATLLVWFPQRRFLHDQNGKGGHVPKEDVQVLRRLKQFCSEAKVPLRVEGQDLIVEFTSNTGDTMRYVPDLGEVGQYINGIRCGSAISMSYNPISGSVTNQMGVGCKIPDKWLHSILSKLAVLCDACDVDHNIKSDVLAMIARNENQQPRSPPPSERRQPSVDLNRQKELQKVEDELALEEAKAISLEKRRAELERLESELDTREQQIKDFEASPPGMFQKLQVCFASQFPNDAEVLKLLGDVVSAFYWFDLCRTFEDSSLDLPTLLHNHLLPASFDEAVKLLSMKNIELEAPRSPDRSHHSIPNEPVAAVSIAEPPQQHTTHNSIPLRKVMTPNLNTSYSVPIQQPVVPLSYPVITPDRALSSYPVGAGGFTSAPNFFTENYRQPLRAPLPYTSLSSGSAVFNSQLPAVGDELVSSMAPIKPTSSIQNPPASWVEETRGALTQSDINKKESSEGLSALDTASHDLDSETPKAAPWKHRPGGSAWDIL
eukprot:TRINITY_DN724_c0_g2_i1.p1 TRINITY_DN724_c0_g2~~TRINITY_DN724_c0_g2_i1.p1  ORF type:complete len:902 (+),score=158.03 TRINITY_DN724_c0_g2_i1:62-2767(+)